MRRPNVAICVVTFRGDVRVRLGLAYPNCATRLVGKNTECELEVYSGPAPFASALEFTISQNYLGQLMTWQGELLRRAEGLGRVVAVRWLFKVVDEPLGGKKGWEQ